MRSDSPCEAAVQEDQEEGEKEGKGERRRGDSEGRPAAHSALEAVAQELEVQTLEDEVRALVQERADLQRREKATEVLLERLTHTLPRLDANRAVQLRAHADPQMAQKWQQVAVGLSLSPCRGCLQGRFFVDG